MYMLLFLPNFSLGVLNPHVLVCGFLLKCRLCNDLACSVQIIALFSAVSLTWRHSSFSLQKMNNNNNHPHNCCSKKKFRKDFTDVKSALPSLITAYHLTHQTLVFADCLRIRAATASAVKFPDKFLPQCVVQA